MELSDHKLVEAAASGDRDALERLLLGCYRRLHSHISGRMSAWTHRLFSADDVIQETYCRAFQDIGSLLTNDSEEFFRWLSRIAEHRLLDLLKARKAKKRGG